jgi:cell division protein FtsW
MNRKVPYDQFLILIILGLVGIGLMVVFSASSLISKDIYGSSSSIFMRQLISVAIGLALLFAAMRTDYHRYQKPEVVVAFLIGVFLLLFWALLSPGVNGVHRWVQIGPMRFQPSELAKLAVILLTSYFLVHRGGRVERIDKGFALFGGIVGSIILMVLIAPDFGTSASIAAIAALLLFFAGLQYRYYAGAALAVAPLIYVLVYSVPYRRQRVLAFLDPEADPQGSGYQILQSLSAVGSGGLTGKGLAQGTQKLFFLPEPHTDFIFAVIGEELGLLGCLSVLGLFILLFWRGIRIAVRADTVFGTYLGLGIVSMIAIQALFNMSVVLSLCPTKGIPLPFVSVGGSSMLVMLTATGILLNISRHTRGQLRIKMPRKLFV